LPEQVSFQRALSKTMMSVVIVSFLSVGALWGTIDYITFTREVELDQQRYYQQQKDLARDEVNRVIRYIDYQRNRAEQQLQVALTAPVEAALKALEKVQKHQEAGNNGQEEVRAFPQKQVTKILEKSGAATFFLYDLAGNKILYPYLRGEKEGQAYAVIQQLVQQTRQHRVEGYFTWNLAHEDVADGQQQVASLVKQFKPYNLLIGAYAPAQTTVESIQQEILAWVNTIRYGKEGYIFVYDHKANNLAHFNPQYIGRNMLHFTDANGVAVPQKMIELAQDTHGGFIEYVGTVRPSTGVPAKKIAYVRGVEDWGWVVGTGVYVDEIVDTLTKKRTQLVEKIQYHLALVLILLVLFVVPVLVLSHYMARRINKDITSLADFLQRSIGPSGEEQIGAEDVRFVEFQGVVDAANEMVEERRTSSQLLAEANARAEKNRKLETLGMLSGNVANDLNNILSAMIGYPDLILNSLAPDNPQRKFITIIKESAVQASNVIDDLLTLASSGSAQRVVLDLNTMLEKLFESSPFRQEVEKYRGITLDVQLDPEILKIEGVPAQLEKVILHLVASSAEVQLGRGRISVVTENCYVDTCYDGLYPIEEGEYVVVRVADHGPVIARADVESVFAPYFSRGKLGKSGSGLKMALIKEIMLDHQGRIEVNSSEEGGTCFTLYFKATRADIAEEVRLQAQSNFKGNGEHILVVDDIRAQQELVISLLRQLNYEPVAVGSGDEAVAYLKEHEVDLVVLDMILAEPEMDGLETYVQISSLRPGQKTILASGYAETERVQHALALGVSQYLKKPYTLEKIGQAIKRVLTQ